MKKKNLLFRLWRYLMHHKLILIVAIFFSLVANLLSLLGPFLAGKAIDSMVGVNQVDFQKVILYCSLMAIFYIISSILSYILSLIMINISQKVVVNLRKDVFNKLVDLPVSYFDNTQTGDILSRITYDIDTIATTLSSDVIQIFNTFIIVIFSFTLMLIISPILVLVFVFTIPISIIMTKIITGKVRPLFKKRSVKLGELNGFSEEIITGHKTIKVYHVEKEIIKQFDEKNQNAAQAYYNADYYGTMVGPATNFITNISIALVSILGVILYLLKQITIGNITSFTLYSRKFSGPINEFANIINELQSALAAAERIFKIIDEPQEKADNQDAIILPKVEGNIEMKDINFGYNKDRLILNNINFLAPSGKKIAIVGATGGGKTTIINLLMRFYDASSGTITLDDNNFDYIKRKSLRESYSMVLQDTWLFHGTIFANIAYAKQDATLEEVIQVAKAAKIDNYINSLKDGYYSILDEEGINISKGQKQLITIARAMLSDAKMLILDEATSNVDTQTEIKIQDAMLKLMKDKTCFIIAHRLSTIINSDIILVINNGMIVEQGTHQELLDKKAFYYQLYSSQFE